MLIEKGKEDLQDQHEQGGPSRDGTVAMGALTQPRQGLLALS